MAWIGIWFGISNTSGGSWPSGVGQNKETDEQHDEDCVEEGFQLVRWKFDRNGEGSREALVWGIIVSIFEMDLNWN